MFQDLLADGAAYQPSKETVRVRADDDPIDLLSYRVVRDRACGLAMSENVNQRYSGIGKVRLSERVQLITQVRLVRLLLCSQDADLRHFQRYLDRLADMDDMHRCAGRLRQRACEPRRTF